MQKSLEEDKTSFVTLQNVIEQVCNYFFTHDRFPFTYEELQPIPLLTVSMLTYTGNDGAKGQAYRQALDVDADVARFHFRYPDLSGVWYWRKTDTIILLPQIVKERLQAGEVMASTLREERQAKCFSVCCFADMIQRKA